MLNLSIIGDQCTGKILPLRYVKSEKTCTMDPLHNEGPRDAKSIFAITRFRYHIQDLFESIYFTIILQGQDDIVRFKKNFVA